MSRPFALPGSEENHGELERQSVQEMSRLDRVSRAVTDLAGSRPFIVGHVAWFVVWVLLVNRGSTAFDGDPYNLLNLLVSLEAIFLTRFVLMTQNRMTKQADRRAHLDLQINLLSEQELIAILQMLYALCQKAGTYARVTEPRVEQLLTETDVIQLAVAIERELSDVETDRSKS